MTSRLENLTPPSHGTNTPLDDIDPDENLLNSLYPDFTTSNNSKYYSPTSLNASNLHSSYNTTLLNCNVCSYNSNGGKLLAMLSSLNLSPSYVVLTETWCTAATTQLCQIPGLLSIHTCRPASTATRGGPGGGVAVFYKQHLQGEKIEHLSYCIPDIETCVSRVNYERLRAAVCVFDFSIFGLLTFF